MHCTCTNHKTCHVSLKSAGLSVNLYPRNTEIQRCPLMAAASFQVALQKQQCPRKCGTGISCKSINYLCGYLVETFDENFNVNASIVFGNSLLQQKHRFGFIFSAGKNGSVLIWSRASDDHDSSMGKQGFCLETGTGGTTHQFSSFSSRFFWYKKFTQKFTQASLLHQAFPIEHSNAMVSFQPPEFGLVESGAGRAGRWDFPLSFSCTLNWSKFGE